MGEALGHVHHPAVLGRQLGAEALAEGGRALAQVEDHVVERPADAADELGLGLGGELVVHAAQRPFLGAERVVDLDELGRPAHGRRIPLAEGPGEEAAVVARFSRSIR